MNTVTDEKASERINTESATGALQLWVGVIHGRHDILLRRSRDIAASEFIIKTPTLPIWVDSQKEKKKILRYCYESVSCYISRES